MDGYLIFFLFVFLQVPIKSLFKIDLSINVLKYPQWYLNITFLFHRK